MREAETPIFIPWNFLDFDNLINSWTLSFVALAFLFFLLYRAKKSRQMVPTGAQNFIEMTMEFVKDLSDPIVGPHAPFFFPLFFFLFFYIFFSNLLGLIPGLLSPTSRVDVNLGMALVVFSSTHFFGIKEKGLFHYLAHFLPPKISSSPNASLPMRLMMLIIYAALCVMMPLIHLIGELVKPVSLTMRLFGNMMAKEKILAVLVLLMMVFWEISPIGKVFSVFPFFLRIFIVVLGVFVSFVQAFVFMLLAMVYIGGAVQEPEGHGPEGEVLSSPL